MVLLTLFRARDWRLKLAGIETRRDEFRGAAVAVV